MFTQKISMDCTQEQYEKYLKKELLKMGYKEVCARNWENNPCLFNNFLGEEGEVGNGGDKKEYNRTYLGKFNAPLYLALAAMTDKEGGNYGEWWYVMDNDSPRRFTHGKLYMGLSSIRKPDSFIDNLGAKNGYSEQRNPLQFIRKATVSEIMAKFGEKEYRYNGRPSWEIILDTTIIEEMTKQHKEMWAAYKELNEKIERPYEPKDGDYFYTTSREGNSFLAIKKCGGNKTDKYVSFSRITRELSFDCIPCMWNSEIVELRPATLEEIALLDSKLAEQGKFFNKETMRVEEIKKEPKIGEMAIGWHNKKSFAGVGIYTEYDSSSPFFHIGNEWYENAIPFESVEQYKEFIK